MRRWLTYTLVLAAAACHKSGGGPAGGPGNNAFKLLPGDVVAVGGLVRSDSEQAVRDSLKAVTSNPMFARMGVPACAFDLLAVVDTAIAAVPQNGSPTVYVHGAGLRKQLEACAKQIQNGQLETEDQGKATRYKLNGRDVWVAWLDADTLLLSPGTDAKGTTALIAPTSPLSGNAELMQLIGESSKGATLWGVGLVEKIPELAKTQKGLPPPKRAWLRLSDTLDLEAAIDMASADDAKGFADKLKELAKHAPPVPQLKGILDTLAISSDGVRVKIKAAMASALQLPGGGKGGTATVAVVGMLAAVAIPAFMKNARKAKTSEAAVNIKKMYDGARTYYEEKQAFPPSTETTPPLGSCCKDATMRCAPDPALWTSAGWQALQFSMDDPSRYSYKYTSDGKTFSVDAWGDLNCNGVFSTFEMVGSIAPDGTVTGGSGLFKDHELE